MAEKPEKKDKEKRHGNSKLGVKRCGEKCPECGSENTRAFNIVDKAFSIHYIDDVADFECDDCGHNWSGQYGYRGLA